MLEQLALKVGGQQGEGIVAVGNTLAVALNRQGYYIYSYRHFSSRIKGGHSNDNIRISTKPRQAISDYLDILLAFDQETIDFNAHELRSGGVIIADSDKFPKSQPKVPPELENVRLFAVPCSSIAQEAGGAIMKNMVFVGATAFVLGIDLAIFTDAITSQFGRKGQKVVDQNLNAIQKGFIYVQDLAGSTLDMTLAPADGKRRLLLNGNEAIGLGSLAAGVRIMPAYPITPASEVMEYLQHRIPKVGGVVLQTEDEIAALNMCIGASYGGARVITSTSGPGLSLMMEAIGLSGMTETPVVIVDAQRGGPSTGLPTKNEQSDMYAALFGTHGEIPKIVLAPSTAEECFYTSIDAFNLADRYQCPVILMTDLALSMATQTVPHLNYDAATINRGKIATEEQLAEVPAGQLFKRYAYEDDGISPRVFPGTKGGLHHVTGVEHNEFGRPDEGAVNRNSMMQKRLRKLEGVELPGSVAYHGTSGPELLIIGIGSTQGVIDEALDRLQADGHTVAHAQVKVISPFPSETLSQYISKAKFVVVIENNATGQLKHIINMFGIHHEQMTSFLKYDGNPFQPQEIYDHCKELV